MKKAFTLLELVFVVVVIGILSAVIIPRVQTNPLEEAAIQLVSHIRYTQHLAMVDDCYDSSDRNWSHSRWTLRIKKDIRFYGDNYDNVWAYSIFSDKSHDGNPNLSEMAKNPNNTMQYLSGGYNNVLDVKDNHSMPRLRIGSYYGITNISFDKGCRSNVKHIHFDSRGRPFNSFSNNSPYEIAGSGWHKLLDEQCKIILEANDNNITIAIEPETGYTHIL